MARRSEKLACLVTLSEEHVYLVEAADKEGRDLPEYVVQMLWHECRARLMERFGEDWSQVWAVRCDELPDNGWYDSEPLTEAEWQEMFVDLEGYDPAAKPTRYKDFRSTWRVYWDDAKVRDLHATENHA